MQHSANKRTCVIFGILISITSLSFLKNGGVPCKAIGIQSFWEGDIGFLGFNSRHHLEKTESTKSYFLQNVVLSKSDASHAIQKFFLSSRLKDRFGRLFTFGNSSFCMFTTPSDKKNSVIAHLTIFYLGLLSGYVRSIV